MAEITMRREHGFDDPTDVRSRIEGLAEKVADRLGGAWHWEGDAAICEAKGVEARVTYDEKTIAIDVDLPLMFRPMRRTLEGKIDEYYERYFGRG